MNWASLGYQLVLKTRLQLIEPHQGVHRLGRLSLLFWSWWTEENKEIIQPTTAWHIVRNRVNRDSNNHYFHYLLNIFNPLFCLWSAKKQMHEPKERLHFFCSFFFFLLGLLSSIPSSSSMGLFIGGAYAVLGGICTESQGDTELSHDNIQGTIMHCIYTSWTESLLWVCLVYLCNQLESRCEVSWAS